MEKLQKNEELHSAGTYKEKHYEKIEERHFMIGENQERIGEARIAY